MQAKYRPPLGLEIFDSMAGRWLAQRTIDRFLDEVKKFVDCEWAQERNATHKDAPAHPSVKRPLPIR